MVFHGAGVETHSEWFSEAVWDGEFADGGFDKTDIVFGTGCRLRGSACIVVSSGSTCDRLQALKVDQKYYVSNSLACLFSATGTSFFPAYDGYRQDINSIIDGLGRYQRTLASKRGAVELFYFNNLRFDGESLEVHEKPNGGRRFANFADYVGFLEQCVSKVMRNLSSPSRSFSYQPLTTLSSGYDSTAVASLVSRHGCTEALSFDTARGEEDDTGASAAGALGLTVTVVRRNAWRDSDLSDIPFLSADGDGEDRYFAGAGKFLEGRVVFTGYHGDKVWDRSTSSEYLTTDLRRGDSSGLSLTEFRLEKAFIHCPLPFWSARSIADIYQISRSSEMDPWSVGGDYDRPICRRIGEEAGVPGDTFGQRKKAASVLVYTEASFATPGAMSNYLKWLRFQRWKIFRGGGGLLLTDPKVDALRYRFRVVSENVARGFRRMLRATPMGWRLADHPRLVRGSSLVIRTKPFAIRKYMFPWAVEKQAENYAMHCGSGKEGPMQGVEEKMHSKSK